MNMRRILSAVCLAALAQTAAANPFCAQMLTADGLEKKYQRIAPIYNSTETGWFFGSDQFDAAYALGDEQQDLVAQIVTELASQGTELAMVVAPPRPVIAGQATVDATTGTPGLYDVAAQATSFQTMIAQLGEAGVIAPDLLALATSNEAIRSTYYFARDTHWTTVGAAQSALALAAAFDPEAVPLFETENLPSAETFGERGSLADIARATCDADPAKEPTPVYDYTALMPSAGGLLDVTEVEAVLVGTSFSDRYKRDQYQAADAMSAALGMSVVNRSVSGGGMIGPFESYVLTGALADEAPRLLIWEFPATYDLKATQLRQVLGSLRAAGKPVQSETLALDGQKVTLPLALGDDLIGIAPGTGGLFKINMKLRQADGTVTKLRLDRKRRMAEIAELETWWIDLSGLELEGARLEIDMKGAKDAVTVDVLKLSSQS